MQGKPDQTSNLRVVLRELDMTEEGQEKRTMLPNLQLFAVAMGTAGKDFAALRVFHELFSDMFEVRVYDKFVRYVVLTDPNLPDEDTDPPDSTLIPSGTRKDFLAEYFDRYRGAIIKN